MDPRSWAKERYIPIGILQQIHRFSQLFNHCYIDVLVFGCTDSGTKASMRLKIATKTRTALGFLRANTKIHLTYRNDFTKLSIFMEMCQNSVGWASGVAGVGSQLGCKHIIHSLNASGPPPAPL